MPEVFSPVRPAGSLPIRTRSIARAAALLFCLAFAGGCHTASDAKTVAAQLSATATALANYYTALRAEVVDSVQLNDLEQGAVGVPYDQHEYALAMDTAAEIQKRIEMANDLSALAASLTQLSASTGAADAAAAAGKFASAAASISPLSSVLSAPVQADFSSAVQGIVSAVQARKIRESAREIAGFLDKFDKQFTAEESLCASLNDQYADLTAQMSVWLVANGQTDPTAIGSTLAKVALAPYGVAAKLDAATTTKLASTAQTFIGQKSAEMKASQILASKAMDNALADIAMRTGDLAANKPLPNDLTPPTLTVVNQWASTISTAPAK